MPSGPSNPFDCASLAISKAKIFCSRPRAMAANLIDEHLASPARRRRRRAAEKRPLDAQSILVVGQVGQPGDDLVIIGPLRVDLPIFPAAAANRSEHADVVNAGIAQNLQIPFEPLAIELVAPRPPEQACAEGIEGPIGIRNRVPLGLYGAHGAVAGGTPPLARQPPDR